MPKVHQQYLVCPFPSYDGVVATQLRKYQLKQNCITVQATHASLQNVPADATLLITGHGVTGGGEISNGLKDAQRVAHSPDQLAHLISKVWLLPKTHRKIRLLGCGCAPFAAKLAPALAGYDQVAVGGYVEDMNFDSFDSKTGRGSQMAQIDALGNGKVSLYTKQQVAKVGLDWVLWFNNQGKGIAKPDIPKTFELAT